MNSRQCRKYKKYRSQLWKAIQLGPLKLVRKLLRFVKADDEMIHSAIAIGVAPEIVDLLQRSAGMPEDELAKCRLSQALEADDTERVQQFLNAGMSPDIVMDSYGNRPLHRARSARMARLLLEAGANPLAVAAGGYTALHSVADAESVAILVQNGLNVNARLKSGDTPLFSPHTPDVAKALLEAGADPCAVNKEGETPLHYCTCSELAEMLLAAGAHVNAEDERGRTPLDCALAHPYQHRIQKQYIATLIRAGGKRGSGQQNSPI